MKQFIVKNKKIVIAAVVVAVAAIIYYFYKKGRFVDNFHGHGKASELGLLNPDRFGGNVGFTTEWKHGFKPGDKVTIKQSAGAKFPQYDGETTVARVLDDYNFTINKSFAGNTPANPGYVKAA